MSASNPIAERIAMTSQRVLTTGADIASLLTEDLQGYPDRELQRRFLADPEGAEAISDEALTALRKAARDLGARVSAAITKQLAAPEPWLSLAEGSQDIADSKDLRDVPAVWSLVAAFDAEVTGLAATVGLEDDDRQPMGYAPPRRFIGRRYLPSLVESYLRTSRELRELLIVSEEKQVEQRKRSLAERWASAATDE